LRQSSPPIFDPAHRSLKGTASAQTSSEKEE
jgi:hypothetical protein